MLQKKPKSEAAVREVFRYAIVTGRAGITLHQTLLARCKAMNLIITLSLQPKELPDFFKALSVTREAHWLLWRLVY